MYRLANNSCGKERSCMFQVSVYPSTSSVIMAKLLWISLIKLATKFDRMSTSEHRKLTLKRFRNNQLSFSPVQRPNYNRHVILTQHGLSIRARMQHETVSWYSRRFCVPIANYLWKFALYLTVDRNAISRF